MIKIVIRNTKSQIIIDPIIFTIENHVTGYNMLVIPALSMDVATKEF